MFERCAPERFVCWCVSALASLGRSVVTSIKISALGADIGR
jgi:hypothetical protein